VLTGLTRDGNFLIENGRIVGPTNNFRFNESPVAVLANVLALGPSERTRGGEIEDALCAAPTLLVKDFTFSSRSDAI
jgi:predicted Zn-dependent protease